MEGQLGEIKMTIVITRAETGKVETVELVGKVVDGVFEPVKEEENGSNPQHDGA